MCQIFEFTIADRETVIFSHLSFSCNVVSNVTIPFPIGDFNRLMYLSDRSRLAYIHAALYGIASRYNVEFILTVWLHNVPIVLRLSRSK